MGSCALLCGLLLSGWPRLGVAQKPVASPLATLVLAPVTAPLSLPGIGKELQRAMVVALKEANIPAQPGKTDGDGALSAKLEELGSGRLRLSLSYRGASSQQMGDLEHLDDLVYAVVAELRPKLISAVEPQTSAVWPGPTVVTTTRPSPSSAKLVSLSAVSPVKREPPTPAIPPVLPATTLPQPPSVGSPVTPSPLGDAEQKPQKRPRVAIGLLGEPVAALPPGYYGLSAVGQQALMSFFQQRLQVPVVATRLYSLVGGFEALEQSLRVSAHHTLMARLDALTVTNGVLSGRIHLVLLKDGKLLYDRSMALPPTVASASEAPSALFSRAVTAALETLSGELSGRLPPQ